ncbi:MAG TPA: hypothetical protein VLZ81_16995 [Blastocatellia bacterium]|nr:hypothetical protein [Blastocatellia bacterium]
MSHIADTNDERNFRVIHPLYDDPELKCDVKGLGRIKMTPTVKFALLALRAYLIVMLLLVLYHFGSLAGIL